MDDLSYGSNLHPLGQPPISPLGDEPPDDEAMNRAWTSPSPLSVRIGRIQRGPSS